MANLELNCEWHFAEKIGGREDGPNNPMDENFKKTPYASLIRESIQNSLDVPLDESKPVKMEFKISRIRPCEYSAFFDLKKHIKGCLKHYPDNEDAKRTYEPMLEYLNRLSEHDNLNYIKISDYNTLGMDYVEGDTSNPFFAFVQAAGVSAKSDATAGGSFGFGKAAYFYISPLRTILVSTQTDKGKTFFEGVASLCTHELDDGLKRYEAVGYYDNNNGKPITNPKNIPARFQRYEPGTDIYIMGVNDFVTKADVYGQMIEAVLRIFWLAILKGKLEVIVDETYITAETLGDLMEMYFPDEQDAKRRENDYNPRPYWEAVVNAGSDSRHFYKEKQLPTIGRVRFYAWKNKNATDKVLYMRKPLMLVKARRTQSSNGFYGVFVCDDPIGNKILRRTENPAHNEWKSSNWREDGKIVAKGQDAMKQIELFIIDMMKEMFSNANQNVQQIQGLEDFLYIPTAVEDDEELESESLIGEVVSQADEGNSMTTELTNKAMTPWQEKPSVGKVMITDQISSNHKRESKGAILGGHGDRPKKHKGGGGLSTKKIEGHYNPSEEGVNGNVLTEIPVTYRSYAQLDNGRISHYIVIHSDFDVQHGRIDLIIGGEQSDDVVAIKSCSEGIVLNNSINGLHILKGKTLLKIQFADNMKHAIKLDAYEFK